jgi:hypothetical protein
MITNNSKMRKRIRKEKGKLVRKRINKKSKLRDRKIKKIIWS